MGQFYEVWQTFPLHKEVKGYLFFTTPPKHPPIDGGGYREPYLKLNDKIKSIRLDKPESFNSNCDIKLHIDGDQVHVEVNFEGPFASNTPDSEITCYLKVEKE